MVYRVRFKEHGLPNATLWSASMDGETQRAAGVPNLFVVVPNGSFSFSVSCGAGYKTYPSSGSIRIAGSAVNQSIHCDELFPVEFTEAGLPEGIPWWVRVNDTQFNSSTGQLRLNETNGTYSLSAGSPGPWVAQAPPTMFVVSGFPILIRVNFGHPTVGSGLFGPGGANWVFIAAGVAIAVSAAIVVRFRITRTITRTKRRELDLETRSESSRRSVSHLYAAVPDFSKSTWVLCCSWLMTVETGIS
jgi:hypothetical protein